VKNYIINILAIAGIIIAFSMISQLERRCTAAEKARDAYRPIVTQYFDSQSGAEDAPPPPSVNADDQMNLRMLDMRSSGTLVTPTIAKWLAIGGFILFAGALSLQSRTEKKMGKDTPNQARPSP